MDWTCSAGWRQYLGGEKGILGRVDGAGEHILDRRFTGFGRWGRFCGPQKGGVEAVRRAFEETGCVIEAPFEGLGIGKRLKALNEVL